MNVLVDWVLKGLQSLQLTFDCLEMCVGQACVLFLCLSGGGGGNSSIYNKCLPVILERMGQLVCSKLAEFLAHLFRVGLVWYTIGICHSAISVFLELHHHCRTSNYLSMSKLMFHFYLHCPPLHNFLLPLLDIWASAFSLTNFKLAWNMALIISTFFLCKAVIFIQASGVRID